MWRNNARVNLIVFLVWLNLKVFSQFLSQKKYRINIKFMQNKFQNSNCEKFLSLYNSLFGAKTEACWQCYSWPWSSTQSGDRRYAMHLLIYPARTTNKGVRIHKVVRLRIIGAQPQQMGKPQPWMPQFRKGAHPCTLCKPTLNLRTDHPVLVYKTCEIERTVLRLFSCHRHEMCSNKSTQ